MPGWSGRSQGSPRPEWPPRGGMGTRWGLGRKPCSPHLPASGRLVGELMGADALVSLFHGAALERLLRPPVESSDTYRSPGGLCGAAAWRAGLVSCRKALKEGMARVEDCWDWHLSISWGLGSSGSQLGYFRSLSQTLSPGTAGSRGVQEAAECSTV